jgi:acetyltransferase-like isoleucine patch superfamily enzyme
MGAKSAICGTSHPYWFLSLSSKEADAQMELLVVIVSYRVAPRNFIIDHFGGIVITGYGKFGDNCQIRNGVVVVRVRRVGDNVVSRANAVVLSDVPNNSVAVGVPAVVKQRRVGQQHVDAIPSKFGRQVS